MPGLNTYLFVMSNCEFDFLPCMFPHMAEKFMA